MTLDRNKTDARLGAEIHDMLVNLGIETPTNGTYFIDRTVANWPKIYINGYEEKQEKIEACFKDIMTVLGLDIDNDSLSETPRRVAKLFLDEIFWGLSYDNFPKCTTVENKMHYDEMVVEKDISIQSTCEHHWMAISGKATVAYIPKNKILGLSKLNRICEYFSRRPQIQERLTEQIFHSLKYILDTDDIAVFIDAEHGCVKARGVQDVDSRTVTSRLGGLFKDKDHPAARAEFMNIATRKE
jgi:GTP cyclohydrolase I